MHKLVIPTVQYFQFPGKIILAKLLNIENKTCNDYLILKFRGRNFYKEGGM
jgi:hypothetical protein